jgi:hypothetical protein
VTVVAARSSAHLRSQAESVQVTEQAPVHTKWQMASSLHEPDAFSPSVTVQVDPSHVDEPPTPTVNVQVLLPEHELVQSPLQLPLQLLPLEQENAHEPPVESQPLPSQLQLAPGVHAQLLAEQRQLAPGHEAAPPQPDKANRNIKPHNEYAVANRISE